MKERKLERDYIRCTEEGTIRKKDEVDIELIKSLVTAVKHEIESYPKAEKAINYFHILFNMKYETLRKIISAYLLFDKIKTDNHICLFAYLCKKHEELDFDYETCETIRITRNNINYEGKEIESSSFKNLKFKMDIYIRILLEKSEKKLNEWK